MNNHAVVIGGSMAGLLTARILSDYFTKVTVIERDDLPDGPEYRKGVPQARHLHVLLAKGLQIMRDLFPGFINDLRQAGAVPLELGSEVCWMMSAGWLPDANIGIEMFSCSRSLLEFLVRQRLSAIQNISFMPHCEVNGLIADSTKTTVTGIRIQPRKSGADVPTELLADLIVDASGRTSHLPEWLSTLGYPQPDETRIDSFLGYATRTFKQPENTNFNYKGIILFPKPPHMARGGILFPLEGNQWIVTLGGAAKDYPPTDEAAFIEFTRSLRDPILYNLIKAAEPLTPIYGYQNTANQLRHYEKLSRFPERLIALGDAVCAFNPIYGQGMTTAGLGALVLKRELDSVGNNLNGFSRRFQKALAKDNQNPWLLATSTDLLYPTTEGGQSNVLIDFQQWYINTLLPLASEDVTLMKEFIEVFHLVQNPLVLFKPRRIFQLLRTLVTSQRQTETAAFRPDFG